MSKASIETDMRDYGLSYPISKQTNADRIRNMSDEELAKFLVRVNSSIQNCMIVDCKNEGIDRDCKDCFLEWLQAEVKEGAE